MSTNTTEAALEACIERHLTGFVDDGPEPDGVAVQTKALEPNKGYLRGKFTDFNPEFAIDEELTLEKDKAGKKLITTTIQKFPFIVDGIEYTEESLDGFPSKDIPDKLAGNIKIGETNYRLLVVANKYLTGFDEPLLHTMYVDKRLQGQLACIKPFANPAWEKLHWFLKFLIPKLRVKDIKIMEHVQESAAYKAQVVDNPDEQNRRIALESLITQAVNKERKKDLDLYKVYAGDPDFKKAFDESIMRILALHEKSKPA